MPTFASSVAAPSKSRNPSIMDADPAIMEAGRNPFRPVSNGDEGGGSGGGSNKSNSIISKLIEPQSKSNSALINKMKITRPLKMKA